MIDINLVREQPDLIKQTLEKKFQQTKLKVLEEARKKDAQWRELKKESDTLRAERNTLSKSVSEAKKAGKSVTSLLKKAKEIPARIDACEARMNKLEEELRPLLMQLPNLMHSSVPLGKNDSENKVLEVIGKPKKPGFSIKNHGELLESLGLGDFNASAKTSGTGFYYLEHEVALLNQALIQYAISVMLKRGFRYIETPLMLRGEVIKNVVDLHDLNNQIYKIDNEDLYLIGTSEHSLIGRYIGTILTEKQLPLKQTSYSMCFRREIGSHGIDEKGLYRTHQFNKIEMIVICKPEDSMKNFEEMKSITIEIFKGLGIPIRVLGICSGDLGDLKHIQVDIEAWSPRQESYFEVGSCSNLTDAQARRLKIRCDGPRGRYIPHTLNNTALATSRALVAILENYQQKDGSILIPEALRPYMHGITSINKN